MLAVDVLVDAWGIGLAPFMAVVKVLDEVPCAASATSSTCRTFLTVP